MATALQGHCTPRVVVLVLCVVHLWVSVYLGVLCKQQRSNGWFSLSLVCRPTGNCGARWAIFGRQIKNADGKLQGLFRKPSQMHPQTQTCPISLVPFLKVTKIAQNPLRWDIFFSPSLTTVKMWSYRSKRGTNRAQWAAMGIYRDWPLFLVLCNSYSPKKCFSWTMIMVF